MGGEVGGWAFILTEPRPRAAEVTGTRFRPPAIPWDAITITKRGRWTWRIAIKDAGEYGVPRWIGELVET